MFNGIIMSGNLVQARAAYASGDYNLALTHLNHLLPAEGGASEAVICLLGETLAKLGMGAEAAEFFQHAAGLDGADAFSHFCRAARLYADGGHDDDALICSMRGHQIQPEDPDNLFLLITLLQRSGDTAVVEQLKYQLIASDKSGHLELALELVGANRRDVRSLILLRKLRKLHPQNMIYRNAVISLAREFCDYDALDEEDSLIPPEKWQGRSEWVAQETPHDIIHWCDNESVNRLARNSETIGPLGPAVTAQRRARKHAWGEKIRIGYLSADFFDVHATMRLLGDVLKKHNPERFDITLFCHTPPRLTLTPAAKAARQQWGRIVDLNDLTDLQAAAKIRERNIDILIDLKGHTAHSRATILNHGAAPVQATWLGFPGSVVDIDLDYVIGDAIVTPDSSKPFYREKFCRLPESYQPNDPETRALPLPAKRADLGLPENAFVFASFNAAAKISRRTIALWARILIQSPHAILWLMCTSQTMQINISRRFEQLGVSVDRLVFAVAAPYADHIARLQAADAGLDTFPYNGHTTTSDKLWAGLPVVTVKGRNFASRVSESLLRAAGLEELTADNDDDFVALAVQLASDPQRHAAIRKTLEGNRFQAPLFDSERFCRHLETAYEMMADRAKSGKLPDHFDVPALPPRTGPFLSRA
jgi:predicted O-linked N-acetylglucosamine transferase (SPINDLY family)